MSLKTSSDFMLAPPNIYILSPTNAQPWPPLGLGLSPFTVGLCHDIVSNQNCEEFDYLIKYLPRSKINNSFKDSSRSKVDVPPKAKIWVPSGDKVQLYK